MTGSPSLPLYLLLALCSNIVLLLLLILQLQQSISHNEAANVCGSKPSFQNPGKEISLDDSSAAFLDTLDEIKSTLSDFAIRPADSGLPGRKTFVDLIVNSSREQLTNLVNIIIRQRQSRSINGQDEVVRQKRGTDSRDSNNSSNHKNDALVLVDKVFSDLRINKSVQDSPQVSDVLAPVLVEIGANFLSQVRSLQNVIVGHDFRIEVLEKSMLNRKVDEDALDHLDWENIEGSGEVEKEIKTTTITTTTKKIIPTTPKPWLNPKKYNSMFRRLRKMEQKMLALESYNVMSDGELYRTRSEVIKMDDKVTEFSRKQRNLQVRTTMQTYRITELESFMARTDVAVTAALDEFSRSKERLDSFKEMLGEYSRSLEEMGGEFTRQTQISDELRAADTYKAHDINGLRGSLLALEQRLNDLYRTMDQNVDSMRSDLRLLVERVCANNFLSC